MEQTHKPRLTVDPQTIAWVVVITSFLLFCIVCAAGTFGAYWFFFESPIALTTQVTVSQGAVTVINPSDGTSFLLNDPTNDTRIISPNAILKTDANSQGYVTFQDNYSHQLISTVYLLENSTVTLSGATRPHFEWSRSGYNITFNSAIGQFAVDIAPSLSRSILLSMQSAAGGAHLFESGSFMIDALDQYVKLYSENGKGLLDTQGRAWQIDQGNVGTMMVGQTSAVVEPYSYDILNTTDTTTPRSTLYGDDINTTDPLQPPPGWACNYDAQQNPGEPSGTWKPEIIDALPTLHIVRGTPQDKGKLGHSEIGCEFWLSNNPSGLDITQYKSLSIRLKLKIIDQDVPTCGILGSECPIMLMIVYQPADSDPGNVQVWRQGFYSLRPPGDTSLQSCDTCAHNHIQLGSNAWYIYDSDDLLKQFPAGKQPIAIQMIRVYASGHQFNVALSEVAILGGK